MEKTGEWERMSLINELTQGHELARQLIAQLNAPFSSDESKEILVEKIEASYAKALSMVNTSVATGGTVRRVESSTSRCASSPSEDSDRCLGEAELKDASKKRKSSQPRWTQQVRVRPGMPLEGSLDDGFSWRKYGQKNILASKYPRGYYRCIHRSVRGCTATKQVQRANDEPTIFEITYIGTHSCTCSSTTNVTSNILMSPPVPDEKTKEQAVAPPSMELKQSSLVSFQKDLNVGNQDSDQTYRSSTSFPYISSTPTPNSNLLPSDFISPTTSTWRTNFSFPSLDDYKIIQGVAATSATSLDFPFGNSQLDQNLTFHNNGFFPQGP